MSEQKKPHPIYEYLMGEIDRATHRDDPRVISQIRKILMDRAFEKLTPEGKDEMQSKIAEFGPWIFDDDKNDSSTPLECKFVREGERVILFPDENEEGRMHIDYAVSAGMILPDDGGFFDLNKNDKTVRLIGISSSLYINSKFNPERGGTIARIMEVMPSEYILDGTPKM